MIKKGLLRPIEAQLCREKVNKKSWKKKELKKVIELMFSGHKKEGKR